MDTVMSPGLTADRDGDGDLRDKIEDIDLDDIDIDALLNRSRPRIFLRQTPLYEGKKTSIHSVCAKLSS